MAPRKRVKLAGTAKGNESQVVANDKEGDVIAQKKPHRGTTNRKSKNTGKLARMLELPLEVFTEIASYLSPYDIIQLARSTKALRAMLISKNSKHVWLAARSSMGVPNLDNLSEPHYADLLFSKRCHGENCDGGLAMRVSFTLGVRFCKACFERETIQGNDVRCRKEYYRLHPSFSGAKDYHFLESSIANITAKLEQCKSPEEKGKAIANFKMNTKRLEESAARIEIWCAEQAEIKQKVNAALCSGRRKSIEERLLSIGYSADDLNTRYDKEGWKWDTILDQPRLLTETIWKNILPKLEETLRLRKDLHRIINRKNLTHSIEDGFSLNLCIMKEISGCGDEVASIHLTTLYRYFPAFQAMLDDPNCVDPISDKMWDAFDQGFENAVNALSSKVERECAVVMKTAYRIAGLSSIPDKSTSDAIPPVLLRATSFFKHNRCLMSYAGILKLRAETCVDRRQEDWHKEVPKGVIGMARALLGNLSLPETSSMLSLEKLGKVFCCQRCVRYGKFAEVLAWSGLVWHFYDKNKDHESRMRKRQEIGVDVPLRNDHDLMEADGRKKIFTSISPHMREAVKSTVSVNCAEDSYSKLSGYALDDWGYNSYNSHSGRYREWDVEGDETDEETPVWTKGDNDDWSCKFCAKLEIDDPEQYSKASHLGKHMKRIHGTDFDGLPLGSKSKSKA